MSQQRDGMVTPGVEYRGRLSTELTVRSDIRYRQDERRHNMSARRGVKPVLVNRYRLR